MSSPDGAVWVVYNGEIFNFAALTGGAARRWLELPTPNRTPRYCRFCI